MFGTGQKRIEKIAAQFKTMIVELEKGLDEMAAERVENMKQIETLNVRNQGLDSSASKANRLIKNLSDLSS